MPQTGCAPHVMERKPLNRISSKVRQLSSLPYKPRNFGTNRERDTRCCESSYMELVARLLYVQQSLVAAVHVQPSFKVRGRIEVKGCRRDRDSHAGKTLIEHRQRREVELVRCLRSCHVEQQPPGLRIPDRVVRQVPRKHRLLERLEEPVTLHSGYRRRGWLLQYTFEPLNRSVTTSPSYQESALRSLLLHNQPHPQNPTPHIIRSPAQ